MKLNPTWLLKLVKLVLAYLRGENSCEDKLSLLFEEIKLSSFINTLSSGLPNTSFPRSVSSTTGSVFSLASSCTVLREGVDLCWASLEIILSFSHMEIILSFSHMEIILSFSHMEIILLAWTPCTSCMWMGSSKQCT